MFGFSMTELITNVHDSLPFSLKIFSRNGITLKQSNTNENDKLVINIK